MRESLTISFTNGESTVTARAGGYKATSSLDSREKHERLRGSASATVRLIKKIYGYTPINLMLRNTSEGEWVATWTEPSKEKEAV